MTAEELIKSYTYLITDDKGNKWEVIEVSDLDELIRRLQNLEIEQLKSK